MKRKQVQTTKYQYALKEGKWRRIAVLVPIPCVVCKKDFKPLVSKNKYCSRPCYWSISNKCRIGSKRSMETRMKLSKGKQKELNPNWRGGVSSIRLKLIDSMNYKQWRAAVFERDDYTCRKCNRRGGKLNADHIVPYFKDQNKIYDLDNGQTLCVECHTEKTRQEMKENWVNQFSSASSQLN